MWAIPRFNINCAEPLRATTGETRQRMVYGVKNYEIETGHDLMITEPRKVADMLLEIARL